MQILETYTNRLNTYRIIECYYNFDYPTLWMIRSNEVEFELCTFGIEDSAQIRVPIGYVYENTTNKR